MPYIFLLIFTFIFTACQSPKHHNQHTAALPVSNQDTDINDLKILEDDSIVGNYILKQGMFRSEEITEGYLVIKEIDANNYGYYYVTIADKLFPETHIGIFFKKDGHFVQKVIEDSSEAEIRQGKSKSKMTIIDNIQLIKEGELLKLNVNSTKKERLIWTRDLDEDEKSEKMKEALKSAHTEYLDYYQEKCANSDNLCGDTTATRVNE